MSKISVAIAGAGLSGLCLAHSLLREGIDVQIYERDQAVDSRRQGYRITVDKHGITALQQCLPSRLFDLFLATASPTDQDSYFRLTNQKLGEVFKFSFKGDPSGSDLRIPRQADRQTLRTIMLEGLHHRIHFGKQVIRAEVTSKDAFLHFSDGDSAHASLLVCAEGVHSALRKQLLPECEPEDTNYWAIYGRSLLVQKDRILVPDWLKTSGVHAIGPPGRGFFFTTMAFREAPQKAFARFGMEQSPPILDDYVMWAVLLPKEQFVEFQNNLRSEELLQLARKTTQDFHPDLQSIVESADVNYTMGVNLRVARKPVSWPISRVTFMGDAVHVMPPTGSHGGNTALCDTALLSEKLKAVSFHEASLDQAIGSYQKDMIKYSFRQVEASKVMMKRLTIKNPLMRWAMLSAVPWIRSMTNKN
ncbi:FAD-dependent oxidoreductase [Brevibacillus borstelensis]|uniref:FAD-dependent oxidoreductase n=1 Tax=Brevibacillus borstelensis TaxID=45462 RepID=UPI0030C209FA